MMENGENRAKVFVQFEYVCPSFPHSQSHGGITFFCLSYIKKIFFCLFVYFLIFQLLRSQGTACPWFRDHLLPNYFTFSKTYGTKIWGNSMKEILEMRWLLGLPAGDETLLRLGQTVPRHLQHLHTIHSLDMFRSLAFITSFDALTGQTDIWIPPYLNLQNPFILQ